MKALLITGVLAEETVKNYAKESKTETEVFALKVQIAAFLNPETINGALRRNKPKGFDMILHFS